MLETLTHSEVHEVDSRDSSRALVRTRNTNYPGVRLATLSVHCRLQSPTLSILGLVLALDGRFHASFSDYSLDPHDSISNQDSSSNGGSRSSRNSRIPHNPSPSGSCTTHGRYRDDRYYDPRYGASVRVVVRKERKYSPKYFDANLSVHQGQREHNGDRIDLRDLLDFYSEEPGTSRSHGGSGMDTRLDAYDDDYEDPFAPRDHNDSERESRQDHRDHMDYPHENHDFNWENYEDR